MKEGVFLGFEECFGTGRTARIRIFWFWEVWSKGRRSKGRFFMGFEIFFRKLKRKSGQLGSEFDARHEYRREEWMRWPENG